MRRLVVPGPKSIRHIDGNHKLIRSVIPADKQCLFLLKSLGLFHNKVLHFSFHKCLSGGDLLGWMDSVVQAAPVYLSGAREYISMSQWLQNIHKIFFPHTTLVLKQTFFKIKMILVSLHFFRNYIPLQLNLCSFISEK